MIILVIRYMPQIYLRKELYDKIIRMGEKATQYVNKLVEERIEKIELEVEK